MRITIVISALLACGSLAGCLQVEVSPQPIVEAKQPRIIYKKGSEQMMCAAQYDPVCAMLDLGDGKTQPHTFSNSCAAGQVVNIISVSNGACK